MKQSMKWPLGFVFAALVAGCPVEERADAGVDASTTDAPVCACDDGIACTRDTCDELGACVHTGDCENGWCAALPDGNTRCEQHACSVDSDCRGDLPCAELVGCEEGFCRYDWAVDRDHDGERDRGCGGNDCQPLRWEVPRSELCDGTDNDCDGVIDNNIDFSSDRNHCGACFRPCTQGPCIAGACTCGDGLTMCPTGCIDTRIDTINCGACGHACPVGGCVDGVCGGQPPWIGLDSQPYAPLGGAPALDVSANGDVLFEVVLRPRLLFSYGRPSEPIPDGESPFPLHAVRLTRDGAVISVTSLPRLAAVRMLAITDGGFYFSGATISEADIEGRHFASGVVVVGFVPHGSSAIAWIHSLSGSGVTAALALPNGSLALLVRGSGVGFRLGEFAAVRLIGPEGVATTPPRPSEVDLYNAVTSLVPTADGGFITSPSTNTDSLPVVGPIPPIPTFVRYAIRHDAFGRRVEALRVPWDARPLCERADSAAWIVQDGTTLAELTRDRRRDLFTYAGSYQPVVEFARYDGSGIAFGGSGIAFAGPGISRLRGSTFVESVGMEGGFHVSDDAVWTISLPRTENPFLPEAQVVIHRTALRPIP